MDRHVFYISGRLVSWSIKRQETVAISTTEAKYITVSQAIQQAILLCWKMLFYKRTYSYKVFNYLRPL